MVLKAEAWRQNPSLSYYFMPSAKQNGLEALGAKWSFVEWMN